MSRLTDERHHNGQSAATPDALQGDSTRLYCVQLNENGVCGAPQSGLEVDQLEDPGELERHGLFTELSRRRFIQASSAFAASLAVGVPSAVEAQEATQTASITLNVKFQQVVHSI